MKKLLLSSAAVIAVAAGAPAFAADLPAYEAPMPVETVATVAPLWTGFYVGGQLGYAFDGHDGDNCFTYSEDIAPDVVFDCEEYAEAVPEYDGDDDDDDGSLFAGVHLGYDQQFGGFVVGAVLEANWLFDHDDDDDDDNFGLDVAIDLDEDFGTVEEYAAVNPGEFGGVDWYGTARLRAGFAWGRALLYATGGLAFGDSGNGGGATIGGTEDELLGVVGIDDVDTDCDYDAGTDFGTCQFGDDDDDIDLGWTLGAGVEFLATNNFSVGVEYLYVNLGGGDDDETIEFDNGTTLDLEGEDDNDFHTISVRGSYRFNFGG